MTQSAYSAVRAIEIQVKSAEDYFANHAPLASEIIERNYIGKLRTLLNVLASPEAPAAVDDGGAVERMAKAYANDDLNWPDFSEDYRAGCREIARRMLVALLPPAPQGTATPINMILFCPACGLQHVDAPKDDWTNPPHKSHLCHGCKHVWRPADVPTNGVTFIATEGKADSSPSYAYRAALAPQPDREAVKREAFLFAAKKIERDTCPTSCVCGDCNKLRVVIDHLRAIAQSPTPAKEESK